MLKFLRAWWAAYSYNHRKTVCAMRGVYSPEIVWITQREADEIAAQQVGATSNKDTPS